MDIKSVVGFDWDNGNWPKCGKHGVSKEEIEAIFLNGPAIHSHTTHSIDEQRFKAIGRNNNGRMIYASFTIRISENGNLIRPVSARYMHEKEIKRYEG